MFNLVAINLPDAQRKYAQKCHKEKCPNEGRYQFFADIEDSGLPDWEGKAICSKTPWWKRPDIDRRSSCHSSIC